MKKVFFIFCFVLVSPLLILALLGFALLVAFNGITANTSPESKDEYYGRI